MTLKPEQIGDKGQRYEVRATGYPEDAESVIGWAVSLERAEQMAAAIGQAPGCTSTTVIDRERPAGRSALNKDKVDEH